MSASTINPPVVGTTTIGGHMGITAQVIQQLVQDENAASMLAAQFSAMAAGVGNPPNNAYKISAQGTLNYSAKAGTQAKWTAATSNGSPLLFGTPYAGNYYAGILPVIVVLPWDVASKSFLVGYTTSGVTVPSSAAGGGVSYANVRRVALDANNAPTITTADVAVPAQGQGPGGASYNANTIASLISGVAASASQFKFVYPTMSFSSSSAWYGNLYKSTVAWDGTNLTVTSDGALGTNLSGTGNSPSFCAALCMNASLNVSGVLVNNNGWLSVGTLGYDCTTLDTGPTVNVAYGIWRLPMTTGCCHDTFGGGSVVQSSPAPATIADTTTRLAITTEVKDAALGILGATTCRISGKAWSGAAPNIACMSAAATFVQFTDTASTPNKWSCLLQYNAATGATAIFGNNYYSAGNLGSYSMGALGFAPFSQTVTYGLRKGTATAACNLMNVTFDTTQAAGLELQSSAANDIVFSVLQTFLAANAMNAVSSVTLHGMLKHPALPDVIVVFGRATVSIAGATAMTMCFLETFTMS